MNETLGETFEARFCDRYHIRSELFERRLFLLGLISFWRPVAWVLLQLGTSLFKEEPQNLSRTRSVTNRADFCLKLQSIADFNAHRLSLWRLLIGLRLSTRRLAKQRKHLTAKQWSDESDKSECKER
ncbi:MAG: hypothetical protein M2R45_02742 [Verrucomicrobia subdivision 3 bacterium]|nr:hypothetical protein [Limisphaerales bacterium]MCS1414292.1 hypothetical protein [Limisphaerales bacterium]